MKAWWIFRERMCRLQFMLHYLSQKYVDLMALFTTKRQYLYKYVYSFMILYTRIVFCHCY